MTALVRRLPRRLPRGRGPLAGLGGLGTGVVAVMIKELRGRFRGRRAFVVLTLDLLLVAGIAWMIQTIASQSFGMGMGSYTASAEIGRNLFRGLLVLQTIIVLVLAPASTAGAISLEREKQTLDLLVTTPISPLAITLGKLLSALSWVFLLLVASIPVTALVFTYGGVAPGDLVRGYLVLFVSALAYGALGLFVSAITRRTQAATVVNLVTTLALTAGTALVWVFMAAVNPPVQTLPDGTAVVGQRRPPEALMWFNPFVAQVDVLCGIETSQYGLCSVIAGITGQVQEQPMPGVREDIAPAKAAPVPGGGGGVAVDDVAPMPVDPGVQPAGLVRDTYWPRAMLANLVAAILLVLLAARQVDPARRGRPLLPAVIRRRLRRPRLRGRGGTGVAA